MSKSKEAQAAAIWFARQLAGLMDAEHEAAFQIWLGASETHREAYARCERGWQKVERLRHRGLRRTPVAEGGDIAYRQELSEDLTGQNPGAVLPQSLLLFDLNPTA